MHKHQQVIKYHKKAIVNIHNTKKVLTFGTKITLNNKNLISCTDFI